MSGSDNRTIKSSKNIVMGLLQQLVTVGLTFVGRKIFINYIGIEYLGINGLFANILSLLALADLGFGTAMSYSFYKPLADRDECKLAALIKFYRKVYNIIALAVGGFGIMLIPFLKYIIKTDTPISNIEVYYLTFLLNTVISYLFVYKSSIIIADQKGYIVNSFGIVVNIVRTIIQIISILIFKNYLVYLIVMVIATFINNLIISRNAYKLYPYIRNPNNQLKKSEKRNIIENLKSVFIYKVSSTFLNSTDSILISMIISTAAVGFYSNYQIIVTNLSVFISILFTSITASIGNLIIKGDKDESYKVFCTMQMVSFWISGFITICVFNLSEDFIVLWLGGDYVLDKSVVFAITLNLFFSSSMQPLWSFREATGLYRQTKYIMLIAAGVNLILSVMLGFFFGLAGIIFATVIAKISTYFWYEPHLLFKQYFGQSEYKYYLSYFENIVIILVCMVIINKVFLYFNGSLMTGFLLKVVICTLTVNSIYLIKNYKTSEFNYLFSKCRTLLNQ